MVCLNLVVKSDNGPPFNGHEFAEFADYLGTYMHTYIHKLYLSSDSSVAYIASISDPN